MVSFFIFKNCDCLWNYIHLHLVEECLKIIRIYTKIKLKGLIGLEKVKGLKEKRMPRPERLMNGWRRRSLPRPRGKENKDSASHRSREEVLFQGEGKADGSDTAHGIRKARLLLHLAWAYLHISLL